MGDIWLDDEDRVVHVRPTRVTVTDNGLES